MTKLKTKLGMVNFTVYISGPMRGIPGWNYPLFHEVEAAWKDQFPGDIVINPAKNFDGKTDEPIAFYMQKDLEQVLSASLIVLLPGWEKSDCGAKMGSGSWARATAKILYLARPKGEAFGEHTGWEFLQTTSESVKTELKWARAISDVIHTRRGYAMSRYAVRERRHSGITEDGKLRLRGFPKPASAGTVCPVHAQAPGAQRWFAASWR